MEHAFWHQRWQEGRIGFHQDRPTPLMLEHWPALGIAPGTRVFVPLCGKSLDLAWLASQGLDVLGVELSPRAVEQFFAEHGIEPVIEASAMGRHYRSDRIEIVCGDAFALDDGSLATCGAVFDRAALIALPPALRSRYATDLYGRLPRGCRGLLITLEYPQPEKAGPPFSVPAEEVQGLYSADWRVELLARHDILDAQPAFADEGVTRLATAAYALQRR